ncbi:gluconate 2-dehydrogenase subunit 3 family protein [Novosphingobium aerophilum]|uniref:gluconate 2-dehydrogenase subunit 3 family protein n=1 Tax=Novosphingobium TaxID=165696 RepID=UPI00163DCA5D|nr:MULTISPECIES: gluconate 2-dehydrogenase subunit 3 family protein [unclassified Novosphingobium]WRT94892.1 gluconate 2-dehydrogenase subunit 3 family protein [Novosphingobium sp. RL4]
MTDPMTLDRRSLIEKLLALAGASTVTGFSWPALAEQAEAGKPALDPDSFMVLSAVADTIIPRTDTPGAVDVKVPALFDGLLTNWAAPERRQDLIRALKEVDELAKTSHARPFSALTPAQRLDLLKAHEAEALRIDPTRKLSGVAAMMGGPAYVNPGYGKLRDLIILLYYLSEPALTLELSYVHTPGEWKPSIPVTPDTRPAGGGLF